MLFLCVRRLRWLEYKPQTDCRHLRPQIAGKHTDAFLDIEAWTSSEIKAISPLVDSLMPLIAWSHCIAGEEPEVELALREALNNAVVHGNRMDVHKLVQISCRCELGKGVSIIVRDHGQGFDPNAVSLSLAVKNLEAERGRGIYLMRLSMDEVTFKRGGTEVHMRKLAHATQQQTCKTSTNPSPQ
jgi:serine/threonine-protein kinase RsbW